MTNLGMERLCLELEQTIADVPDVYFQQLRSLVEGEHRRRRALVEGEDKVWVNMSPEEQNDLMYETNNKEMYEDWSKAQKLKKNRRYPKQRELTLADK